jgi:hypothetical protein
MLHDETKPKSASPSPEGDNTPVSQLSSDTGSDRKKRSLTLSPSDEMKAGKRPKKVEFHPQIVVNHFFRHPTERDAMFGDRDAMAKRLLVATILGDLENVRYLLDCGADPNGPPTEHGPGEYCIPSQPPQPHRIYNRTPLMQAVQGINGDEEEAIVRKRQIATLLLQHHSIDLERIDSDGRTALIISTSNQDDNTALELIVKYGANPHPLDKNQRGALWWATYYGQEGTMKALLEHGADPNIKDNLLRKSPRELAGDKADAGNPRLLDLFTQTQRQDQSATTIKPTT